MEIELKLTGSDASETNILSLQDWIKHEQIEGLRVERKFDKPKDEDMGIDPGQILAVILGSTAIVELVKSLHVWIKTTRPKAKINLKMGDNEIDIDTENLPELQSLVESVIEKVKTSEAS